MSQASVLLCSCTGTFAPDAEAIARGCGVECSRVHHYLCRDEASSAAAALGAGGEVVIACGQEAAAFAGIADDLGASGRLTCVDIRDRAGWSEDAEAGEAGAGPKMAALVAEARLGPPPPVPSIDVSSAGVCLVYGPAEVAVAAAARLAPLLAVTLMLTEPEGGHPSGQRRARHRLGAYPQRLRRARPLRGRGRPLRRAFAGRAGARLLGAARRRAVGM